MKPIKTILLIGMAAVLLLQGGIAEAALKKGGIAPRFTALKAVENKPMVILYFFKLSSKPSVEGLEHLRRLYGQYQNEGIEVIAISQDDPKKLDAYLSKHPLPFKVVKNGKGIFGKYQVKFILPATFVLGPGARISDAMEGGGATSHHFITTVAQRSIQLNKTMLAKTLYESALKSDPKSATARTGLAQVYMKEGKLDQAEEEFSKVAKLASPEAILGMEGLAELHLQKGEYKKAIAVAKQIEKEDPNNGLVHLIKGNVLAASGKNDAALSAFNRATQGKLSNDRLVAQAYNNAGRIHSERSEYALAESMYEEAVVHNPYSSEILTNRGVLYEKRGQPKKALALYQQALSADPEDEISQLLAKRIAQHLAFKEDMERQKRVDALVNELADRYQKGRVSQAPVTDPWSSRPMTIAFLGFKSMGGGLLREGVSEVLQQQIAQDLMATGRITVVEREMMDKLLAELKLGSSELADPETALKLGRILSARLIVTGSLVQVSNGVRLSLRMIDPETSAIRITHTDEMSPSRNLLSLADLTAQALSEKLKEHYPLRGKIAVVEEQGQVIVNLGSRHGVTLGTTLRIIDEGDPIVVDGKTIGHRKKNIGFLEIVEVEEALSYGKLREQKANVEKDQKVLEEVRRNEKAF